MIIKKPYAFLIKNFRKIHIVLIALGIYVFYKCIKTLLFVNEFMIDRKYDAYGNSITKYISTPFKVAVIIMAVGSIALMILLRYKHKPWKLYLIPSLTYLALYVEIGIISGFFTVYTEMVDLGNLRLANDFFSIGMLCQIPSLVVFGMRILGLDLKSFSFKDDLDDLELTDADREEIEVGLSLDIYTFIRLWRRLKRNAIYFYEEHKIICKTAAIILAIVFLKSTYQFLFVENRVYRQGQYYNINGYTMKVTNSYFTDKDVHGNVITSKSNFIIVEYEVTNHREERALNTSYFHIRTGNKIFGSTEVLYSSEFQDLGEAYKKTHKIRKDETLKFIVIYKVPKRYRKGRFYMYYQEQDGRQKARKIKLKTKDISKMEKEQSFKTGDFFDIKTYNYEDTIAFDGFELSGSAEYRTNSCTTTECELGLKTIEAPNGYQVMSLDFASDTFESKNMIDFLSKYGKIEYKDSNGKVKSIDIEFLLKRKYLGKILYIKIPNNVAESKYIAIKIVLRTKTYICQIT